MKLLVAFAILLVLSGTSFSEDSATGKASLAPKDTIRLWNFEDKTVDGVLPWYEADTFEEKQLARATAEQAISVAKLQKAVRTKWGHDAETTIAHLCLTDTREDDDAATVTINGDHAILKYSVPEMAPLFLILRDGVWKIDIATYLHGLGDQLQASIQYCHQSSIIYEKFTNAVVADKYQNVQEAAGDLKKAMDALDANQ